MIYETEIGVVLEEDNEDNGRSITISPSHGITYYVARDPKNKFRSAGIVESLVGITNLMYWLCGKDWDATGLIEG